MKKVFLSLVLLFAFSISFAANNVEKVCDTENTVQLVKSVEMSDATYLVVTNASDDFGTCTVTITVTNQDGEVVGSGSIVYNNVGSAAECAALAQAVEDALNEL